MEPFETASSVRPRNGALSSPPSHPNRSGRPSGFESWWREAIRRHPGPAIVDDGRPDARASMRSLPGASSALPCGATGRGGPSRAPRSDRAPEVDYFHFAAPSPALPLTLMPREVGTAEPAPELDLGLELEAEVADSAPPEPIETAKRRARVRRRTKLFMSTCAILVAAVALHAGVARAERHDQGDAPIDAGASVAHAARAR